MSTPCIILAGGLGTRLRSAVPDLPKCLAPVGGKPFLEWQLQSLAERGIDRFVLALGHGADEVVECLTHRWAKRFEIETVIESELLGTGGAALFAMNAVNLEEALIANGDTFIGGSLQTMLMPLDLVGGEFMRIATVSVADRARFGGVSIDASNCVTAFLEKGQSGAGQINAGLYRVRRDVFDMVFKERAFSMETQVMPRLVANRALHAQELTGPFIDIGVPEDYRIFDAGVHDYVCQA